MTTSRNGGPADAGRAPAPITVYGTRWCMDCHLAKHVLDKAGTAYEWIDIAEDDGAARKVAEIDGGLRRVPTIVFPDGRVLVEPSVSQLRHALDGPSSAA